MQSELLPSLSSLTPVSIQPQISSIQLPPLSQLESILPRTSTPPSSINPTLNPSLPNDGLIQALHSISCEPPKPNFTKDDELDLIFRFRRSQLTIDAILEMFTFTARREDGKLEKRVWCMHSCRPGCDYSSKRSHVFEHMKGKRSYKQRADCLGCQMVAFLNSLPLPLPSEELLFAKLSASASSAVTAGVSQTHTHSASCQPLCQQTTQPIIIQQQQQKQEQQEEQSKLTLEDSKSLTLSQSMDEDEEEKEFLCPHAGCRFGIPKNGYTKREGLKSHKRRYHKYLCALLPCVGCDSREKHQKAQRKIKIQLESDAQVSIVRDRLSVGDQSVSSDHRRHKASKFDGKEQKRSKLVKKPIELKANQMCQTIQPCCEEQAAVSLLLLGRCQQSSDASMSVDASIDGINPSV